MTCNKCKATRGRPVVVVTRHDMASNNKARASCGKPVEAVAIARRARTVVGIAPHSRASLTTTPLVDLYTCGSHKKNGKVLHVPSVTFGQPKQRRAWYAQQKRLSCTPRYCIWSKNLSNSRPCATVFRYFGSVNHIDMAIAPSIPGEQCNPVPF